MHIIFFCVAALAVSMTAPLCAADDGADKTVTVKALSYNIRYGSARDGANRWEKRRDLAIKVAKQGEFDFIGMQEAEAFQIKEYAKAMPGYGHVGRTREVNLDKGEACPIFYRKDRWQIDNIKQGTVWLSDTPQSPGSKSWGNTIPRIITYAVFTHKKTGQEVLFLNTHFDHRSQNSRVKSAQALLKEIEIHFRPWQHLVVTGDFNAGEQNDAIKTLRTGYKDPYGTQHKFIDTFRVKDPAASDVGTFNGWTGRKTGEKIDYVFILDTAKAKVIDAKIVYTNDKGRYPSDHYPVSATVEFPFRKAP